MSKEFGMERLKEGLWKALRKTAFFPAPNEIEGCCVELIAAGRETKRIAREKFESDQRTSDLHEWQEEHRKEFPEQYDNSGKRIPMVAVISNHDNKTLPVEDKSILTHEIVTEKREGWFWSRCTCGKKWTTPLLVAICPGFNFAQHSQAILKALEASFESRRTKAEAL